MYRRFNRPSHGRTTRSTRNYTPYRRWMSDAGNWLPRMYGGERRIERASVRDLKFSSPYCPPGASELEVDVEWIVNMDVEMASVEELLSVIHVTRVDLHTAENCHAHRTSDFDISEERTDDSGRLLPAQLIVRRGQAFNLTLTFNRPYIIDADDVFLLFTIGDSPLAHKKTRVKIAMAETKTSDFKSDPFKWGAVMTKQKDNDITISVYPAANCVIGEWEVSVQTILQDKENDSTGKIFNYKVPDDVIILLNPWCKDDAVYMPTTRLLDEYVLNENGYQYYGNHRQIGNMPWLFGQFEEGILEVALTLLRLAFNSKISDKMADPARIARALSQSVNSSDEGGVLTGNWSGDYRGGSKPTSWNGSVAILQQYRMTGKPVKFGQCWVFSGVLTSVCRALGLPARSVTNFRSAHDTDESVAIDKHFKLDKDGRRDYLDFSSDSIWNFHVWNEVWMARRDLPAGFDGWQAVDATPQEASDGIYCCGPCPLSAIKNGYVSTPYDGAFIFAEVNAHVVHWKQSGPDAGDWEVAEVDKYDVGRHISTKKPLSDERLDVTHEYKYADGSQKEYSVMKKVSNQLGSESREYLTPKKDFAVSLIDKDEVYIGRPFDVSATVKNTSENNLTLNAILVAMVTTYTGKVTKNIKLDFKKVTLKPNEGTTISMDVSFDEYYQHLVEGAAMKVRVEVVSLETRRSVMAEDDFRLIKPLLVVSAAGSRRVRDPLDVTVSFVNPLSIPLTNCLVTLEARNLEGGAKEVKPQQQSVAAGEEFRETIRIKPKRAGRKEIIATFDSTELEAVSGSFVIIIE